MNKLMNKEQEKTCKIVGYTVALLLLFVMVISVSGATPTYPTQYYQTGHVLVKGYIDYDNSTTEITNITFNDNVTTTDGSGYYEIYVNESIVFVYIS